MRFIFHHLLNFVARFYNVIGSCRFMQMHKWYLKVTTKGPHSVNEDLNVSFSHKVVVLSWKILDMVNELYELFLSFLKLDISFHYMENSSMNILQNFLLKKNFFLKNVHAALFYVIINVNYLQKCNFKVNYDFYCSNTYNIYNTQYIKNL